MTGTEFLAARYGRDPHHILNWRVSQFLLWLDVATGNRRLDRLEDGLTTFQAFHRPGDLTKSVEESPAPARPELEAEAEGAKTRAKAIQGMTMKRVG